MKKNLFTILITLLIITNVSLAKKIGHIDAPLKDTSKSARSVTPGSSPVVNMITFKKTKIKGTGSKGNGNAITDEGTSATPAKIPFDGMDMTWQNGNDRRDSSVFHNAFFTPEILVDGNYSYSFTNPIDNTNVGSTAIARDNEMEISCAAIGGDFQYEGARGRIMTQFGTRSTVVPRNDLSPYRGQYDLADVYRYISEAYAGYHFNKWYGINVDFGMFMSYVGLNSYYQAENWEYQASYTSDNTPWFFNGMRIQTFPSKYTKVELWFTNGWQSYGKFNQSPGLGFNVTWCPNENIKLLTNDYYGKDDIGKPNRVRFHSDNSFLWRYFHDKKSKGISQMALSATFDIGAEYGAGVTGFGGDTAQNFISGMLYNRIWFHKNKFAWTVGGGVMSNPGRYLVLYPTGEASPLPNPYNPTQGAGGVANPNNIFQTTDGLTFKAFDYSSNIDWMPNQSVTFRLEYVHRHANVPYFAGHGGVTSPSGYTVTPLPANWKPDLVNFQDQVIFAVLFRL